MKSCSGQNVPVPSFSAFRGGGTPRPRENATCAARPRANRARGTPTWRAVRGQAGDEEGRQAADVEAEEPGDRLVAVVEAAAPDLLDRRAEPRGPAGDVGRDLGGPVSLLVPGEQVAGQAEAQGEEHQSH